MDFLDDQPNTRLDTDNVRASALVLIALANFLELLIASPAHKQASQIPRRLFKENAVDTLYRWLGL